LAPEYNRN